MFGVEGGDGFDETGDGEGVADAAGATDEMQPAALAGEGDGELHDRGNAGTVDLRNIIEVDDEFAGAALHQVLGEVIQMLAGLTDREAAVDLEVMDAGGFAHRDFQRWMKRHEGFPQFDIYGCWPPRLRRHSRLLHYTMKGMENKSMEGRQHPWKVSTEEARAIQERLRESWEGADRLGEIRTVAGLDASFVLTGSQALQKRASRWKRSREANQAIGCVVVYRFAEAKGAQPGMAVPLEEIERAYAVVPLEFPYIPGLLSFREVPALLAALKKLKELPDVLFCDGQGYAHPRRFGLACHLGVLLDRAAIGCAKSILIGKHGKLGEKPGSWTDLVDETKGGERIGAVVRTRRGVRPVYVSQGHRVSLESAIRLTLEVADGFRIPRPTRDADHFASEIKRRLLQGQLCEK